MAGINTPQSSPDTLLDTLNLSKETQEKVLGSFRGLLTMPGVLDRVETEINNMENGIPKQLLIATLRRVENITDGAEKIHATTHQKLENLLARVDTHEHQSA